MGNPTISRVGLSPFGKPLGIECPRVLFWVPHGIGDAIMILPAIIGMRAAYPNAHIDAAFFRTASQQILEIHGVLDRVHLLSPKSPAVAIRLLRLRNSFDLVVIPPGLNLWKHRWAISLLNIKNVAGVWPRHLNNPWFTHGVVATRGWSKSDLIVETIKTALPKVLSSLPLLHVTEKDYESAVLLFNNLNFIRKKIIVVAPGCDSKYSYKRWDLARFIDVTNNFLEYHTDWAAWIILGPGEEYQEKAWRELNHVRVVISKGLSISVITAAFRLCRIVLANDSALAHIAGISDVPSVVIFGPTDPDLVHPSGREWTTLEASGCDLQPCFPHFGERFNPARCPYGFKCLDKISTKHVLEVLERRLTVAGPEKFQIINGDVICIPRT